MKKIVVVTMLAIAMVFMSACSSGEFYELKKSPCACDFDNNLAHRA